MNLKELDSMEETAKTFRDTPVLKLIASLKRAYDDLKFYADGGHWTTNDDEKHFIKVRDQDWEKQEHGGFCGGKRARQAVQDLEKEFGG